MLYRNFHSRRIQYQDRQGKASHEFWLHLTKAAPQIDTDYDFRVRLFQIPHPPEGETAGKKTA